MVEARSGWEDPPVLQAAGPAGVLPAAAAAAAGDVRSVRGAPRGAGDGVVQPGSGYCESRDGEGGIDQ